VLGIKKLVFELTASNYKIFTMHVYLLTRLIRSWCCELRFLGALAKLQKQLLVLSWQSVCLHGTTQLTLDGFSWKLIFDYFPKICQENASFTKIW